jgi:glutamyl/glutaminyl-tRNA synthetase
MFNTRIAPSPTGDMHMGTARTAYFNWLIARSTGGKFILRIDDTDLDRSDSSKTDDILKVMDWLGLDYDELVYQSDRFDRYSQIADALIAHGFAVKDGDAVRLNQLHNTPILGNVWHDNIAGNIRIDDKDRDYFNDMVIIKSDGSPTYNFASVIDDIDYNISYVVRGVDHLNNTAKQVMLYQALLALSTQDDALFVRTISSPNYAHVSLLFKDKKKLSKRHGAASMIGYMDRDYDPDAVLNFLLRLGWGPRVDDKSTAILTRQRSLELFVDGGRMKSSQANVDLQKLDSFDRKHKGRKRSGQL